MKIYAMSDIHGFIGAFLSALEKVGLGGDNKLVLLGDHLDYGEESRAVLEEIMRLEQLRE